jgi:AcrR family transcriptional regulator
MARPPSAEKRQAIVAAAVMQFAQRGVWSTPTAAISDSAGIAEGTLFRYFQTKHLLVNEVHRVLTRELADTLLSAYPIAADARIRFKHLWDRYVHWGITHPDRFRVLVQLQSSAAPASAGRAVAGSGRPAIERLAKDSIRKKRIRNQPLPYLAAIMAGLAQTTVVFLTENGRSRIDYSAAGFEIFWAGIKLA